MAQAEAGLLWRAEALLFSHGLEISGPNAMDILPEMESELHLTPTIRQGDFFRFGARLVSEGGRQAGLHVDVPERHGPLVGATAHAFTILGLFSAMRRGGRLHVHAPVSRTLRANLQEFSIAWSQWAPELYRPLTITSEGEQEAAVGRKDCVLLPFSGGLDSCHNLWTLLAEVERGDSPAVAGIQALLVHGFDIPLEDEIAFEKAEKNAEAILKSVGVELISVRCNIRRLPHHWENEHGAALAACLHLFDAAFDRGLVAGSHSYASLRFPWGSNPISDPLLSSDSMQIEYRGLAYGRNQKARMIAEWPEAMQRLRPCWQGVARGANCGRCIRCIGTALNFAAEGIEPPAILGVGSPSDAVRRLEKLEITTAALTRLEDSILAPARENAVDDPWVHALDRLLSRKKRNKRRQERIRALRRSLSALISKKSEPSQK